MRGLLRITELKAITIISATTFRFRQRFRLFHIKLKGRHDAKLGHLISMANHLFCIPAVFKANHDLASIIRVNDSGTVCWRELPHNAVVPFGQQKPYISFGDFHADSAAELITLMGVDGNAFAPVFGVDDIGV